MRVVLAHGHIFKNAGSTFDWSLERNFSQRFLDHRDDKAMRKGGTEHLRELLSDREDLVAVSSHHMCPPPQDLHDTRVDMVFLLRHPLERIASVYAFERQQESESPGAKAAKAMNFQDYVSWRMQPGVARTIRDYQTYYLAALPGTGSKKPLPRAALMAAHENLAAAACVGLVDRYDESMVVFEHRLREDFPDIDLAHVPQNVNQHKKLEQGDKVSDVLQRLGALQNEVLLNNSYDLSLYRAAGQQLDAAIAQIADFPERLAKFQQRCKLLHN